MEKPVVLGLGELLWDMLPAGKRAGGAPVNFVYHAVKNGGEGVAVSAVGDDELGHGIETEVKNANIRSIVKHNAYPTGTVAVSLEEGIPTYTIVRGVAWDHIPYTTDLVEAVKKADAICYGTLACRGQESHDTIMNLVNNARPDALKYYDINIRGDFFSKDLIDEQLKAANVFKLNDDELVLLRPMFSIGGTDEEACQWFIDNYNLDYVILTCGGDFSYIVSETGETSRINTPKVEVNDTVGAGDSFSGVFTVEILKGSSLKDAHRRAVNVAAYVCTKAGAWPEYPDEIPDYVAEQNK